MNATNVEKVSTFSRESMTESKMKTNMNVSGGCEKAFGNIDEDIDYVINLASETRKGQLEPVYKEGIHKLSLNVAENVQRKIGNHLKTYVEFSTYSVYTSDKVSI
jgi:NAD dependent epimerase/dehydratase family enzyme